MLNNIRKLIKSYLFYGGLFIGIVIIAIPSSYFMNKDLIIGNLGHGFWYGELILTILISTLFGIFLGASLYKIKHFSIGKTTGGIIAGFFGVLVSGCPSCSITLASYLGLASFLSILPYNGIELKIISVIILLYVNYDIIKNLEICKIKKQFI